MTVPSDPFFLTILISAFPVDAIALIGFESSKAIDPGLSSSIIVTIVLVSPPSSLVALAIGTEFGSLSS